MDRRHFNKSKMDKILFVSLILISIAIFGCVSKPKPTPVPTPTPIPVTPTPSPTPILKPKLIIPDKISFGEILQDTPVKGELEIKNSGDAPLTIYSIKAPHFIKFTSEDFDLPHSV